MLGSRRVHSGAGDDSEPQDGQSTFHEPGQIVRTKEHPAKPMTVDDALYEMELVGHDFFLFHDKAERQAVRGVPQARLRLRIDSPGLTPRGDAWPATSTSHLRWTSSDTSTRSINPQGKPACSISCSGSAKAAWSSASSGWLTTSTPCPTTSRSSPTPSCAPRPTSSRSAYADGEDLDDLMPEAFAVAREAAWRVLDQRPYDVQVMGGAALHFGNVAEMKTGEGKTLTCVLPAYLNALSGKGVHVVTVNDYLAKRDSEWMGRVHRFLGLEVGVILAQMTPDERRVAYSADITYGTNNEFGFDYLRDNMAHTVEEMVQRGTSVRRRRRGRLHPDRRGPHAADHLRSRRRVVELVHRVRAAGAADGEGQALRGRPAQAHHRRQRDRRRVRRGPARHREPLRGRQLAAGQLPEQRDQGQRAVHARQGLHRPRRRGADRRRVHRPRAARPPLQRGHAPGHRGQGKGRDQGREPDAGHHHAAELLPALRQARRDDRHGPDRGRRAARDLQARRGDASPPTSR